jgi:hypothetical protein
MTAQHTAAAMTRLIRHTQHATAGLHSRLQESYLSILKYVANKLAAVTWDSCSSTASYKDLQYSLAQAHRPAGLRQLQHWYYRAGTAQATPQALLVCARTCTAFCCLCRSSLASCRSSARICRFSARFQDSSFISCLATDDTTAKLRLSQLSNCQPCEANPCGPHMGPIACVTQTCTSLSCQETHVSLAMMQASPKLGDASVYRQPVYPHP